MNRRAFLGASAGSLLGMAAGCAHLSRPAGQPRTFHLCLAPDAIERDPELIEVIRAAGITTVWLAGFFYGHWPYSPDQLRAARQRVLTAGLACHVVNVPLGHPGDSLGSSDGGFPLTPPTRWRTASRLEGTVFAGTSLHAPATDENCAALKALREAGFERFFLDDDFRLARGPGEIGGCFCAEHRQRFLATGGYPDSAWGELLADVRDRRPTRLVRAWIEFTCTELTASFRAQAAAAGAGRLGIMIMYLGAEKAGIRLADYRDVPMRVGELMFDDAAFGQIKGKTDELFSALFHRRFVRSELAFSETTAFPADRLSAAHLAAKLAVSTIADVRNTTFMSGVTPFPKSHWETLGPAMKVQSALHAAVAGHRPRGPLKHFWGWRSRWVGNDQPYSLFLATGVPFEVTDTPARDGWTFLSDADAGAVLAGELPPNRTRFVCRPAAAQADSRLTPVPEGLADLFAFKARIAPHLEEVPHVVESVPVVCAWYPTARVVLLWNLLPSATTVHLTHRGVQRPVPLPPLGTGLVTEL